MPAVITATQERCRLCVSRRADLLPGRISLAPTRFPSHLVPTLFINKLVELSASRLDHMVFTLAVNFVIAWRKSEISELAHYDE